MDGSWMDILRWLMDWDLEVRLLYASLSFNRENNKSSQLSQLGVHVYGDINSFLLYDTCAHPELLFSESSSSCSLSLSFAIAFPNFRHLPPGNTSSISMPMLCVSELCKVSRPYHTIEASASGQRTGTWVLSGAWPGPGADRRQIRESS